MSRAALEMPEVDLDGRLPFVRPLPHVSVLQDTLSHLFQDDYAGAEEAEARGEHTLEEKFGERWAPISGGRPGPLGPPWPRA